MKWRLPAAVVLCTAGAFLPLTPASTWTHSDGAEGAPTVTATSDELVAARRAAGEADSQAGFLTQGTVKLKDGSAQLDDQSQQLLDGIGSAHDGAQQLADGMVEIQAGTGQLADGATQVADAVGGVVDQVVGFEAVRGQVVASIDSALAKMGNSREPDIVQARETLTNLREQARTAEIPADVVAQMNQLKSGSREVANQLAVPGYGYHDGIYSATKGAADLASGLSRLDTGADAAGEGIGQLRDGAAQIDTMAGLTSEKIDAVQRALPAAQAGEAEATTEASPTSTLAPLAAMLLAALVVCGGFLLGSQRNRWVIGGGAVFFALVGYVLAVIVGSGLSATAQAVGAVALVAGALASAGLSRAIFSTCGPRVGLGVAAALVTIQIGVVGWVWKSATTGAAGDIAEAVSSAMPMHWVTAALSAAGNGGAPHAMWLGIALSAALAAVGLVPAFKTNRTPRDGSVRNSPSW
ncbi:hypothetical protein CAPI_00640 [Corynebacterium capitovis DSM 44611]|uniref:membrane protein n=1 Tax=Corynebacterium capitovis TaxID=131081 RepID=UPI00058BF446|nr:membrane protein [Corynebacterium capitovis]WKD56708.1 hypothetical protein CAPI_00640 [Corynebacterium capitovis DSM 44611]